MQGMFSDYLQNFPCRYSAIISSVLEGAGLSGKGYISGRPAVHYRGTAVIHWRQPLRPGSDAMCPFEPFGVAFNAAALLVPFLPLYLTEFSDDDLLQQLLDALV